MKTSFLVCLLVLGTHQALAATADPADRFLQAYFLVQEADQAERSREWAKAQTKFRAALDILHELKTESPEWNPLIIEFRLTYCTEHLTALAPKVTAPPPAETATSRPPPGPAAAPAPPPDDSARTAKLTADLQQAQEKIRQLESNRDELATRLKTALREVSPTATNLRIEQLLENNKELAAQLAAGRQQIADLAGRTAELKELRTQARELTTARDDLSAKLKEALAKVADNEADRRVDELLQKNRDLTAQLAAAQAQLASTGDRARKQTAAPEVAALQAQLANTGTELDRVRQELTATRDDLGRARKDLETARAENRALRETYQQMASQVAEATRTLQAAQLAGKKDDEIIRFLRKENQLLRQIVDQKTVSVSEPPSPSSPRIPELKGWHPRRRPARGVEAVSSSPKMAPVPPNVKESARGKLVAELTAPPVAAEPGGALAAPLAGVGAKATVLPRSGAPAALGPSSGKTSALIAEARTALALKDYETAAARYESVLKTEPTNLVALSNLAVVRYQQGKLDAAEQTLRRAVELAPNDSESRALLGLVYFRQGKLEEAFGELTRAVALNPRNAAAHNYLGITLSEKGWGATAEQEIRRAVELNPDYADAHFNLAVLYANQRAPRYEMARHHYQRARALGAPADLTLEATLKPDGPPVPAKPDALPKP